MIWDSGHSHTALMLKVLNPNSPFLSAFVSTYSALIPQGHLYAGAMQ